MLLRWFSNLICGVKQSCRGSPQPDCMKGKVSTHCSESVSRLMSPHSCDRVVYACNLQECCKHEMLTQTSSDVEETRAMEALAVMMM